MTGLDESCGNCRFGIETDALECRRNAPDPRVVHGTREGDEPILTAWWPAVSPAEWCGQWEPKP